MDRHTLEVLNFPRIRLLLAQGAQSPQGEDLCLAVEPATALATACNALEEVEALIAVEPVIGFPPTSGLHRIEGALDTARRDGTCLDAEPLLQIRETVGTCHRLQDYLEEAGIEGSILGRYHSSMVPLYELEDRLERTFGPRGEVLDTASPELAEIRSQLRRLRDRILRTLEAVLGDRQVEPAVRDDFITQRGDRYVIPLKTDFRGYLEGIIHDRSRSGATFLVEPLEAVELNNQMSLLREKEEQEVRRILLELTRWVGRDSSKIRANLAVAAHMDLLGAKLRLAQRLRCTKPELVDEPVLEARGARHPLLDVQEGVEVVPVDIFLGRESRLLLITGANAGGKTVALKTTGLLVLMSRSGLYVPTEEGSRFGWFEGIYADIGDEQDIDRNLSTFSAHVAHLRDILASASSGSLVLLDELGTGTDPREGGALAMAALDALLASEALVVATTHLAGLKAYVYGRPDGRNASVAFDPASGRPLFRLLYGQSGASNALDVAERLGLPSKVLARARAYASAGSDAAAEILAGLERARDRANRAAEEAAALRGELERQKGEREALLAEARRERDAARSDARNEAERLLAGLRVELRGVIASFARREATQQEAEEALRTAQRETAEALRPEGPVPSPEAPEPLSPGDPVHLASLGAEGILEAFDPDSGKAEVRVGTLRVTVPTAEVRKATAGRAETRASSGGRGAIRVSAERGAPDVVVIGCTVEEALARVDWALDRALLSGVESFRVVHGRGTGALRRAVREHLSGAPHVRNVCAAGGDDAVTAVEIE